jgi:poly-D-alanine transfer protein DltD
LAGLLCRVVQFFLAQRRQANASGTRFVDLNAVLCPAVFLAQEFTRDGIHLNWKGCLQFRTILAPHLPANPQQSQTN